MSKEGNEPKFSPASNPSSFFMGAWCFLARLAATEEKRERGSGGSLGLSKFLILLQLCAFAFPSAQHRCLLFLLCFHFSCPSSIRFRFLSFLSFFSLSSSQHVIKERRNQKSRINYRC
jgi:hypothetical protein